MARSRKTRATKLKRTSLLDYVQSTEERVDKNKYCERSVLRDEASVEQFFVARLLSDFGYTDKEIHPKETLDELVVSRGRRKEKYRPDYALVTSGKPRWILDAKGSSENIDKWSYQGAGYALGLNRGFPDENPCQHYVITNGLDLALHKWDAARPVLTLGFGNFVDDDPKFLALRSLLAADLIRAGGKPSRGESDSVVLKHPTVEEVKRIFNSCHRLIWKAEKMSPQAAFFEFVKIMFVKLWQDRKLHQDPTLGPIVRAQEGIPKDSVIFSKRWIDSLSENGVHNPVDTILFQKVAGMLEEAVIRGEKKPIFRANERIALHEGTVRQVIEKLEPYDMFSIDEDLNGRLFETFLSATMRGEALGQYFTPRSIVKLMVRLAAPKAGRARIDKVLDACCGSGGFLIEALTEMRNQIRANRSLSTTEAEALLEEIANESIIGIDAGREPPLARIARINMYLHGDGGSRIYAADALDKEVTTGVIDEAGAKLETEELKSFLAGITAGKKGGVDIVLTNPPFAMDYSEALENEKRILEDYELATFAQGGARRSRASLRSSIMFVERYEGLLKEHGKLVTVIDDAILSGKKYNFAPAYIRERFLVRAVISLPGDAFQRVGARAKTSVLFLERRGAKLEQQPDVFMYECQHLGLDDVPMKTRPSRAAEARELAKKETEKLLLEFAAFMEGKKGPWLVPSTAIKDRLDVKSCLPRTKDVADDWVTQGIEVVRLDQVAEQVTEGSFDPRAEANREFVLLRIGYNGIPEEGDHAYGQELTYRSVQHPRADYVVISNINAAHGAMCVIPKHLEHTIVSSEFTMLKIKDSGVNPWFLWGYLRSIEVRARLVSTTTGLGRHRVTWDALAEIPVPKVKDSDMRAVERLLKDSVRLAREAATKKETAANRLTVLLDLENDWAVQRVKAAKPPK